MYHEPLRRELRDDDAKLNSCGLCLGYQNSDQQTVPVSGVLREMLPENDRRYRRQWKAPACALDCGVFGAVEAMENRLALALGNARSAIGNAETPHPVCCRTLTRILPESGVYLIALSIRLLIINRITAHLPGHRLLVAL